MPAPRPSTYFSASAGPGISACMQWRWRPATRSARISVRGPAGRADVPEPDNAPPRSAGGWSSVLSGPSPPPGHSPKARAGPRRTTNLRIRAPSRSRPDQRSARGLALLRLRAAQRSPPRHRQPPARRQRALDGRGLRRAAHRHQGRRVAETPVAAAGPGRGGGGFGRHGRQRRPGDCFRGQPGRWHPGSPGSSNPADADRSQAQEAAAGAFWSTLAVHAPNNDADALTRWCADGRRCAQSVLGFADRLCAVGAGLAEGAQARAMQSASDVMTPYGEAAEWVSVAARLGWNSAARDMAMAAALTRCDPGGGPN